MPLSPLQINTLENSATGRAIAAVDSAQGTLENFVTFTTDLVRDVFKTVIDSSIEQLEAYGQLVAQVSGTLADYELKVLGSVTDQDKKAREFANQVVLASYGKVTVTGGVASTPTISTSGALSPANVELDIDKLDDLKGSFAGVVAPIGPGKVIDDMITVDSAATPPTAKITATDLVAISLAKLKKEVKGSYDKLVAILKLGMQKIVVTDGEISTSLTFSVDASDTDEISSHDYQSEFSSRSTSWGVRGGFGGSRSIGGSVAGLVVSRSLGGSISGGISQSSYRSKLKVNVVNEKKTAVTTASIDITGAVKIRFRSDFFPSFDPAAVPLPA